MSVRTTLLIFAAGGLGGGGDRLDGADAGDLPVALPA